MGEDEQATSGCAEELTLEVKWHVGEDEQATSGCAEELSHPLPLEPHPLAVFPAPPGRWPRALALRSPAHPATAVPAGVDVPHPHC